MSAQLQMQQVVKMNEEGRTLLDIDCFEVNSNELKLRT